MPSCGYRMQNITDFCNPLSPSVQYTLQLNKINWEQRENFLIQCNSITYNYLFSIIPSY